MGDDQGRGKGWNWVGRLRIGPRRDVAEATAKSYAPSGAGHGPSLSLLVKELIQGDIFSGM